MSIRDLLILSPAEAKGKIAKNLIAEPFFRKALGDGNILVNYGSTNAYILNELGCGIDPSSYTAGKVSGGKFSVTPAEKRHPLLLIRKGKPEECTIEGALAKMGPGDLFLKGANMILPDGSAGIYIGSPTGGTVSFIPGALAKGIIVITPVSISKTVSAIPVSMEGENGLPAIFILKNALLYTEINAFSREGYYAAYMGLNGLDGNELVFETIKR